MNNSEKTPKETVTCCSTHTHEKWSCDCTCCKENNCDCCAELSDNGECMC